MKILRNKKGQEAPDSAINIPLEKIVTIAAIVIGILLIMYIMLKMLAMGGGPK